MKDLTLSKLNMQAILYGTWYNCHMPIIYTTGEIDGTWQEHAARHAKLRSTLYIIATGEAAIREHNWRRQLSAQSSSIANNKSNASNSI